MRTATLQCCALLAALAGCQSPVGEKSPADKLTVRTDVVSNDDDREQESIRQVSYRLPEDHREQGGSQGAAHELPLTHHQMNPYSPPIVPQVGQQFVPPPPVPREPRDAAASIGPQGAIAPDATTLESFESLACANNPTLVQARAHTQAALGMAIQAGLWPNPQMALSGEELGADGRTAEFLGATVRQEIITAHKQQLSRAKYLARTAVAEWVAIEQQFRVLNDVRIHYFRTLGQQQITDIQRELLKNAEDELLTRREQYNVGQATIAGVHGANIALQRQRLAVLESENKLRTTWQELTALAGVDLPFARLSGTLEYGWPAIQWHEALDRVVTESPQMQAARSKVEADRMQLQRELVQSVPNVAVRAGAGQDFTSVPSRTVGMASIELDLPIWNRNEGTVREARSDLARQQSEIRRVELHLRQLLAREYERYITEFQHVQNFRDVILPEAKAAYAVLLDSYGFDRVRWTEVLAAQRDYFDLRSEYIEHLIGLRESEVKIVGYLLSDGLMAPPNPVPPGHINVNPQPR
ncbi:MAG: TolC family protein [Planctomycetota bacterium]|nr:MAG: TolC family protein [Planctomycetota bacterium]